MDMQTYRENRAKFSEDELKPYDGKWVAFSADGSRIVASGETLNEIEQQLAAAGENPEEVGFEKIVFEENSFVGGAEFL